MRSHNLMKIESVDCGSTLETCDIVSCNELKACRVCLSTNSKLIDLHENKLAETLGEFAGTPVLRNDGFPQHLCVICNVLLKKSSTFRSQCRQTQTLLQDMCVLRPVLTTEEIRNLSISNIIQLSSSQIKTFHYIPNEETEKVDEKTKLTDENKENEKEEKALLKPEIRIKEEPDNSENNYADLDDTFAVDDLLENIEDAEIVEPRSVKLENDILETERYSLRKSKRKKKVDDTKNNKVKKKLKKVKKIEEEVGEEENLEVKIEVPKKRLYNKKTEEDFESFSKIYNVAVVFLTKEQQIEEIQSRKLTDEYISGRFQCEICFKSFMKESAYNKHMDTHDPSRGSHACDICLVRFPVRHKLMKHLRRHRTQFICKFCNRITKDSTMAKMHFKWHEGFKYECKHCGRLFNKPSSYMNHVRENHTLVTCDICDQSVPGTRGLNAHKANAHSENYKCLQCGVEFHNEAALVRHSELAAGRPCDTTVRPCPECGVNTPTLEQLKQHQETEHKNIIFRCHQCNTTYSSDRQLGIHWSRAHKGQRRSDKGKGDDVRFMCEVCARSYPSETTLRYHQRIHTGERPYPCPMCPKRFRMKTNLQVHINTHTGERPHKCALCPETFKSYSQKHKHRLLVHTKERRYKCHMCDKSYVVSFDLKMHVRSVHMKIPLPARNRRRKTNVNTVPNTLA